MADIYVESTANSQMIDFAYLQQAAVGETPLNYSGANLRLPIDFGYQHEGVRTSSDFVVTQNGGGDTSVNISAGMAVIQGDSQTGQGKYIIATYGTVNIPGIPIAAGNAKSHLLVAEIEDKQALPGAVITSSQWHFRLLVDVTGPSQLPALPANAIPIARIDRAVGVSAVTTANITDLRTYCAPTGTYRDRINLKAAASEVVFSNIPRTLRTIRITGAFRGSNAGTGNTQVWLQLAGDTAANYLYFYINANVGVSAPAAAAPPGFTTNAQVGNIPYAAFGEWASMNLTITAWDQFTGHNGCQWNGLTSFAGGSTAGYSFMMTYSGSWVGAAALTSIKLFPTAGTNFIAGSEFDLRGEY